MPAWDVRPKSVVYKGRDVEVFTRGNLALALNRTWTTIRSMEQKGILSRPRIKNKRGVWLYTRDQIEDLVTLAIEEGVIDPRYRRPFSDRFVTEAKKILNRLP